MVPNTMKEMTGGVLTYDVYESLKMSFQIPDRRNLLDCSGVLSTPPHHGAWSFSDFRRLASSA